MPDTIEGDFTSEPIKATATSTGGTSSNPDRAGAAIADVTTPDLKPLIDVAEGRVNFMMDICESALRSGMLVSAAGLECGTILTRGWQKIGADAANAAWRTSQISMGVSTDVLDRLMDLQIKSLDATAARMT